MNPKTTEPCYAVIRTDDGRGFTVKMIVWSAEEANNQVFRLNGLNKIKGCAYHWEKTRASRR